MSNKQVVPINYEPDDNNFITGVIEPDSHKILPAITSPYVLFIGKHPKKICTGYLLLSLGLIIYAIGLLSSFSTIGGFVVSTILKFNLC